MPLRYQSLRLAGCGFLLGLLPASSAAQECVGGQLALEARAALLLPPTFGIQGVLPVPDGSVLLWSAGGEVLSVDSRQRLSQRQLPESVQVVGLGLTQEGQRWLDRLGQEYLLSANGSLTPTTRISLGPGAELDQALWWKGGWVLALRDRLARRFRISRVMTGRIDTLYRSPVAPQLDQIPRYHLTDAGESLLVTGVTTPFQLFRLHPASGRVDTLPLPLAGLDPAAIPADSLSSWRALPTVAIDCALLLTLSDLTADRRLLVRYGATDRVEQVTSLAAPFGLVASLAGDRQLLAARRAGELELVWYNWHWVREPSSPAR